MSTSSSPWQSGDILDGNGGRLPLSFVNTLSKYSFNKFAFSMSDNRRLPFLSLSGATPVFEESFLFTKL